MRKTIVTVSIVVLVLLFPSTTFAVKSAGDSALISYNQLERGIDDIAMRKIVLKRILVRYNSPLLNEIDAFVGIEEKYNLPSYLLPSITGLESYFGRYIYPYSYNPFGWDGGYQMFESWEQGIDTVGKGLRLSYIDKGADTVETIGSVYAENPLWSQKVRYFMRIFDQEEQKMRLFFTPDQVEL